MLITAATVEDIPCCVEIRGAAFRDQAPSAYSEDEVTRLLDRDETSGMRQMIEEKQLFVARIDEALVGLAGWRDTNIYNLYVHPQHMRNGIGARLLGKVEEDFFVRTGLHTILVDAGLYTKQFYESQGYEVLGRPVSNDGLAYLEMSKRLS